LTYMFVLLSNSLLPKDYLKATLNFFFKNALGSVDRSLRSNQNSIVFIILS